MTKFFFDLIRNEKSKITLMKNEKIELSFFDLILNQKNQKLLI